MAWSWLTLTVCAVAFADPAQADPLNWSMLIGGAASHALIINSGNLGILFRAFNTAFQKGLGSAPTMWAQVATRVPSTTGTEDYGWLGDIPGMREWIGDRQINNLSQYDYSIKNKEFENTVGVPRPKIEDDQYGVYSPLMEMLGRSAPESRDILIFGLLAAGFCDPML